MDTILSTNILFYVLSLFLICLTIGFGIFVIHIIKILKGIISFLKVIKDESEKIAQDIENIKSKVTSGGAMFASFVVNILSFLKDHKKTNESAKAEKKSKK